MNSMMSNMRREAGVVSIMVTMVLMIVISLIVLGFAEISRNEQRSALDDQLSAQAYYAAESGINDARTAMDQFITAGQPVPDKPGCSNDTNYTLNANVSAAFNVSYTCLTINASPTSLVYDVGYTSTVIPIFSNGSSFGSLTLSWKVPAGLASTAAGCFTNVGQLGTWPIASGGAGAWTCNYPVLRVDFLDANSGLARANWNAETATMFLVPMNSGAVPNNATLVARGTPIAARCNAASCVANIVGLGGRQYYMRVTTLYRTNSSLTITAAGNRPFSNAQATIDSTGKAQDVLRRVLVAVDLTDANEHKIPTGALVTNDSVCKRFGVTNGSFQISDDMSSGGGGNALCNLQPLLGTPSP